VQKQEPEVSYILFPQKKVDMHIQVWRERCFMLITVPGFNFFKVPPTYIKLSMWFLGLEKSLPMPGARASDERAVVQHAEAGLDGSLHQTSCPSVASEEDG
jgi:hypothetical protein